MRVHIALSYRNLTVIARDAASAEANRLLVVTDSKEEFLKHYKGTKEWDTATPVAGGWRLAGRQQGRKLPLQTARKMTMGRRMMKMSTYSGEYTRHKIHQFSIVFWSIS